MVSLIGCSLWFISLIIENDSEKYQLTIIWVAKEEISAEEFQKFINVPLGQVFAIDVLINIWKSLDISLMGGQTPYPRVFQKQLSWIF